MVSAIHALANCDGTRMLLAGSYGNGLFRSFALLGWAALKHAEPRPDEPRPSGVARSRGGGRTWTKFSTDDTRATIIPSPRFDLLLAGRSKDAGEREPIEVSSAGDPLWRLLAAREGRL